MGAVRQTNSEDMGDQAGMMESRRRLLSQMGGSNQLVIYNRGKSLKGAVFENIWKYSLSGKSLYECGEYEIDGEKGYRIALYDASRENDPPKASMVETAGVLGKFFNKYKYLKIEYDAAATATSFYYIMGIFSKINTNATGYNSDAVQKNEAVTLRTEEKSRIDVIELDGNYIEDKLYYFGLVAATTKYNMGTAWQSMFIKKIWFE
jgi:hypothetical protein